MNTREIIENSNSMVRKRILQHLQLPELIFSCTALRIFELRKKIRCGTLFSEKTTNYPGLTLSLLIRHSRLKNGGLRTGQTTRLDETLLAFLLKVMQILHGFSICLYRWPCQPEELQLSCPMEPCLEAAL